LSVEDWCIRENGVLLSILFTYRGVIKMIW